jgi:short-subunit dehydrogenase
MAYPKIALDGAVEAVMPHMIERGRGHVVNVASMAGKLAVPGMAVYNASTVLPSAVRTRRAEITVPRYLPAWDLVNAATPEPVMRVGRRLIGDRRALTSITSQAADR